MSGAETTTLAAGGGLFKDVLKAAETAFKRLFEKGKYHPKDLADTDEYKTLISATDTVFSSTIESGVIPDAMAKALREDVFIFSGLKTHAQLFEASRMLTDENGKIKPFDKFRQDIKTLNDQYNKNYLEAEYNFAKASTQQAGKWSEYESMGDRYLLQYRTAGDDKVRPTHQALANITLPINDPFWDKYYPPNGWNCRCVVKQVRKGKYEVSDSQAASKAGDKATTQIGKNGKNKMAIFRFNPAKQKKVFPPGYPYSKVAGASQAKKAIKK